MALHGRRKILVPYEEVNKENLAEVMKLALPIHLLNAQDMDFLFRYHKGIQPVLDRKKDVRPEICNKIVVNLAQEIVSFKVGYLLWRPIQYVARRKDVSSQSIDLLGDYTVNDGKESKDKTLAKNMSICGVGVNYTKPNEKYENDPLEEAPYETIPLNPKMAFAIYSTTVGNKQIAGVILDYRLENGIIVWRCQIFTETRYYVVESNNWDAISEYANPLGAIPVVEYPLNEERIGDFEIVLDLLNSVSLTLSNQVDGVEQFVQALLVFRNVDIDNDSFKKLKDAGAIKIKDNTSGTIKVEANVEYLNQELNQSQVNSLVENMCNFIREIVGMPAQSNGQTNDGSNNGAQVLKGGWYSAEARATNTEMMFKESERKILKINLYIANVMSRGVFNLKNSDIDIKFTRRNYEDIVAKANVLVQLLQTNKVAPRLAFATCGLFTDPDQAYKESEQYIKDLPTEQVVDLANGENQNQ